MRPIVCTKSKDDMANVSVTLLNGTVHLLKQSTDFSFTGKSCLALKKQMVLAYADMKAGIITKTDTEVYLGVLAVVYGKNEDWFVDNMDLLSIKALHDQVQELINGEEKNA
jgi:hypothetical protein